MAAERHMHLGIAALVHQNEPSVADPVGQRHGPTGQVPEIGRRQHHPAQRVDTGRVEPAGDHDGIRREVGNLLLHQPIPGRQVGVAAAARRQRDVAVEALARAAPAIRRVAGVQRVVAILVQRHRQHVVAVVENRLGPVAVMHVPVDDGDALGQPCGLHGFDGDGDIGQQAETVGPVGQAVVPRRTRQGIGVADVALQHVGQRRLGQPGRQRRDLEPAGAERCAQAQLTPAGIRQPLELLQECFGMHPRQVFPGGRRGRLAAQLGRQAGYIQQRLQPTLGLGPLGQPARRKRLHQPAHG